MDLDLPQYYPTAPHTDVLAEISRASASVGLSYGVSPS